MMDQDTSHGSRSSEDSLPRRLWRLPGRLVLRLASLPPAALFVVLAGFAAALGELLTLVVCLVLFHSPRPDLLLVNLATETLTAAIVAAAVTGVVRHMRGQQKSLERFATVDELTGAPNRRVFLDRLEVEVDRSTRQGIALCVVFVDVDFFKRINDDHGHQVGDAVLKEIFARLEESLRPYDFVGRYGGDEFVMALPGTTAEGGTAASERLRESVREGSLGRLAGVTISLGVAALREKMSAHELLRNADAALYRAKNNGRNRTETYSVS
jgi:diguanylate cyclase (GGDEF)-like protein